jgi:nicotinamidase-related amidase
MAITALDPVTALIVIDLQKGIVSAPTVQPVADVVRRSVALLEAFRRRGLPVVLVNVDGVPPGRTERGLAMGGLPADFAELIPELNRQPGDHVVTKRTRGAFTGTDLETWLRGKGVTQVVLVGVATSAGVESTARHAHELGFNVTLAIDAMADRDADTHANSVTRIFPGIGETGTTQEILDLLASPNGAPA